MRLRFWCLVHRVPLGGVPAWAEAEGAAQWSPDTSDMWCTHEDTDQMCNGDWVTIVE